MGTHRHILRRTAVTGLAVSGLAVPLASLTGPGVRPRTRAGRGARHDAGGTKQLPKVPVMTGSGGAVTSVDRDASQVGIDVLARGGNAADAAVATAAALGVTEPYSAGIGGGGFLVYYDATHDKVRTIDGRETAPQTFTEHDLHRARRHRRWTSPPRSTPGCRSGVPGTPATVGRGRSHVRHQAARRPAEPGRAARAHGLRGRPDLPRPDRAERRRGSRKFPATARVFLPGGSRRRSGSVFRNPDMAKAYRELRPTASTPSTAGGSGAASSREAPRAAHRRRRERPAAARSPARPRAPTAR